MKLMIEILEEDYIRLRDEDMFGNVTTFKRAVREGIPLEQEPCTDAISRHAVLMEIDKYLCGVPFEEKGIDEVIKELPLVTPTEKVGHWIEERTCMECSSCHDIWHYEENQTARFKYCPTCGQPKVQEVKE